MRPGITLHELIKLSMAHGSSTLAPPEDHPQSRFGAGRDILSVPLDRIDSLANGRVVRVKRTVMANGWWVTTHEDVTDTKRNEARIAYLAHTDVISVLMLDLDHFKYVNDSLGHAAGDLLLKAAGQRLETAVHGGDMVARFGGDEFAIIHAVSDDTPGDHRRDCTVVLAGRVL